VTLEAKIVIELDKDGAVASFRRNGKLCRKDSDLQDYLEVPEGYFFIYALLDRRPARGAEYFYAGKTGSLERRMNTHRTAARRGVEEPVYDYIRKMNSEGYDFDFRVLEVCLNTNAVEREIFWMNGLAAMGYPIHNERGIVVPEVGPFSALALLIRGNPRLRDWACAFLNGVLFDPFEMVAQAIRSCLERTED